MQKIFFDDDFHLTRAVQEGWKNMTRRIAKSEEPRYKVGEVVAVAQCLRDMGYNPRDTKHRSGAIWGLDHTPAWTNKMFVYASECILRIRITAWRRERLQEISDEDCLREGVFLDETAPSCYQPFYTFPGSIDHNTPVGYETPREAFADLIRKMSGKSAWDDNPYVDVYEFELVK